MSPGVSNHMPPSRLAASPLSSYPPVAHLCSTAASAVARPLWSPSADFSAASSPDWSELPMAAGGADEAVGGALTAGGRWEEPARRHEWACRAVETQLQLEGDIFRQRTGSVTPV